MGTRKTIPASEIRQAIDRLAGAIADRHRETPKLIILGIAAGGVPFGNRLSEQLSAKLGRTVPAGTLDISFHRDDYGLHPIPKELPGTEIPVDPEGAVVLLADDVIFSGRTLRAALEELFAHGRPEKVELAVLVDRENRKLPFAPDYTGFREPTSVDEKVRVKLDNANPQNDSIRIQDAES